MTTNIIDPWTAPLEQLRGRYASLSQRQRQIADGAAMGQPAKVSAAELGISYRTAEIHRAAAKEKLGVAGTAALAIFVYRVKTETSPCC